MKFVEYNSLENTYRKAEIERIVVEGLTDGNWIVEEKVHGANFSIYYDGSIFKCAKRTSFLSIGEKFFNWESVLNDNQSKISLLYDLLYKMDSNVEYITVYGELFGGSYPHKDAPKVINQSCVQKGVYYSPSNMFYAFDLKINGEYRLTVSEAKALFDKVGLFHAKTLFVGSFSEALNYPNEFQTTIPNLLGLPEIENNTCEGVVIKPDVHKFTRNGSKVVLKNKNDKWSEKSKDRKKETIDIEVPDEVKTLISIIGEYITENRLRNLLSKIGSVTNKDFGLLLKELNKDVYSDFEKDLTIDLDELEPKNKSMITKHMNKLCAELIRNNFLNIIDGVF
jgi:Rnl2 family RNA ligase